MFLPGNHVFDRTITVSNVARLTMHGQSSSDNIATIVRNGSVGFSFTNMLDFNIHSLAFTSYNRSWSYGSHPASSFALFLQSVQNAKLVNCSFYDNLGTALKVYNSHIFLADNEFIHNRCHCGPFYEKCKFGCGITAFNSTLLFTGNTTFLNNSAGFMYSSGAIWASASSLHFSGTNNFIGNSANNAGGAISAVFNTSLNFTGTSDFCLNSAEYGGAIGTAFNVVVNFAGNKKFIGNSAKFGGAIFAGSSTSLSFSGTSEFSHNSAKTRGGAIYTYNNTVFNFTGTNKFISNYVNTADGGAICAYENVVLTFNGTNAFSSNSAAYIGGAIYTYNNTVLTFNGTNTFNGHSAKYRGGVIYAELEILLKFIGTSDFSSNSAEANGGAIYVVSKVVLTFNGSNKFLSNSAHYGGAIFAATNISLNFNGTSSFGNNSAILGGAIFAYGDSKLTFNRSIIFINNGKHINNIDEVSEGGALFLTTSSTFSVLPHTTVCWEQNFATLGGAIFVENVYPFMIYCTKTAPKEKCFFQLPGQTLSNGIDVQLVFKNNSADAAGSVLYGGAIDNCKLTDLDPHSSGEVFDMLFHIKDDTDYNTTSKISSDPLHICPCKDNLPDCSGSLHVPNFVYPGETFHISAVTVGQRDGTVSSTVRSAATLNLTDPHPVKLLDYQHLQYANNTCTKFNYTVFSLTQKVKIEIHPENSPCSSGSLYFLVNLHQTCPPGFNISEPARSCVCEPRLAQYTNQCNITNGVGRITRDSNQHFWIGYDHSSHEIILHPHCPFDYCVNDTTVFPLNNTDLQCEHNRSGLLCGRCKEGYSLVLGTSECRKCTNNIYLALLIPFALLGVVLVFLLLACKLTVATGTLSGLVFYANIVGANHTLFLPVKSTDALSVFIAWLNLDFGIETCFYDGMNVYSKTWLQFVFPAYIWLLVGLTILVSHFSSRFAKLLGSNPVSVLATLILLSYAKVLRTFITAVYFTHLDYQTYSRTVWLYDGNIDYLSGKHIPLFVVAVLVFLFFFLPYTLLLLFGQWLQTISHLRLFSWVNSARLKPFMDSYHAPYKAKHRYWPGLLLVLRFVLLLVFALNPQQDPNINLLAILLGAGILQLWAWTSGGVYKNWCLDALEGSVALNLIMLVGATYCVKLIEGNQLAVGYTSVSIAFGTFIVVLAYHIFQQLRHTKLWKKVPKLNLEFKKLNMKEAKNNNVNANNDPTIANYDQLREPWLEDLILPTHSVV